MARSLTSPASDRQAVHANVRRDCHARLPTAVAYASEPRARPALAAPTWAMSEISSVTSSLASATHPKTNTNLKLSFISEGTQLRRLGDSPNPSAQKVHAPDRGNGAAARSMSHSAKPSRASLNHNRWTNPLAGAGRQRYIRSAAAARYFFANPIFIALFCMHARM